MLPTNRSTRKRTKAIEPKRRKDWLAFATLIMTIIFGIGGVYLANEQKKLSELQNKTSVDLINFSKLLHKTDSVIILSKDQLVTNREVQEKANAIYNNTLIGSMNRLRITAYDINDEHLSLVRANLGITENEIKEYRRRLNRLMELLVSEMDNTYLNSDVTMTKLWSLTYGNIAELDRQLAIDLFMKGKRHYNPTTGERWIGKFDSIHASKMINQMDYDIFTSVGALGYIYIKSREDRIKWGLLGKNGKPDIKPIDFYK